MKRNRLLKVSWCLLLAVLLGLSNAATAAVTETITFSECGWTGVKTNPTRLAAIGASYAAEYSTITFAGAANYQGDNTNGVGVYLFVGGDNKVIATAMTGYKITGITYTFNAPGGKGASLRIDADDTEGEAQTFANGKNQTTTFSGNASKVAFVNAATGNGMQAVLLSMAITYEEQTADWTVTGIGTSDISSEETYYLMNVNSKLFLAGTNSWGTNATVSKYPQPFTISGDATNGYTLTFAKGNGMFASDAKGGIFVDMNKQGHNAWNITDAETEGNVKIQLVSTDDYYNADQYLSATATTEGSQVVYNGTDNIDWKIVKPADVNAAIEEAMKLATENSPVEISSHFVGLEGFPATTWQWTKTGETGWKYNTNNHGNYTASNFAGCFIEAWTGSGNSGALADGSCYQEHSNLPNGKYSIDAYVIATQQTDGVPSADASGVKLFANDDKTGVASANPATQFSVTTKVTDGNLKFGLSLESAKINWIAFDNMTVNYSGNGISTNTVGEIVVDEEKSLDADGWYYFDAVGGATYTITVGDKLTDLYYTLDGSLMVDADNSELFQWNSTDQTMQSKRYYIKSSSAQTIKITVKEQAYNLGDPEWSIENNGYYDDNLSTITVKFPDAETSDTEAYIGLINNGTATVNGTTVTTTAEDGVITIDVSSLHPFEAGAEYTVSFADGTVGYTNDNGDILSENEAFSITFKTPTITTGTYYLQKKDEYQFITRAGFWGTEACVDEYGIAWELSVLPDGSYQLKNVDHSLAANTTVGLTGTGSFYTDQAMNGFNFISAGEDNCYYLQPVGTEVYLTTATEATYKYNYLSTATSTDAAITWVLLTADDYATAIEEKQAELFKTATEYDDESALTSAIAELIEQDCTDKITDAMTPKTDSWTLTQTQGQQNRQAKLVSDSNCAEVYGAPFQISQEVSGLEAGIYKVTVDAFYRAGGYEAGVRVGENQNVTGWVYATSGDHANQVQLINWSTVSDKVNDLATFESSKDNYENVLYVKVDEGETLTIGIRVPGFCNGIWAPMTNWTLTRYSNDITLDETETEAITTELDDANVTLDRDLVKGWNSIVLPFDVDATKAKEAFGDDYEVATYSSDELVDEEVILHFTSGDAITANTPHLLYLGAAVSDPKFEGVSLSPSTSLTTAGTTYYDFVGTYTYYDGETNASPIVSDDYIVNTTGIVKANGGNLLKAFRAYLKSKSSDGARSIKLDINGSTTGIETINGFGGESGTTYNLKGQRVNGAQQKGVYIRDGRKVVIK